MAIRDGALMPEEQQVFAAFTWENIAARRPGAPRLGGLT
jgi:hypothetical protein